MAISIGTEKERYDLAISWLRCDAEQILASKRVPFDSRETILAIFFTFFNLIERAIHVFFCVVIYFVIQFPYFILFKFKKQHIKTQEFLS